MNNHEIFRLKLKIRNNRKATEKTQGQKHLNMGESFPKRAITQRCRSLKEINEKVLNWYLRGISLNYFSNSESSC